MAWLRAAFLVLGLVQLSTAYFTCSRGMHDHDWVVFEKWPNADDKAYLRGVADRAKESRELTAKMQRAANYCYSLSVGGSIGWHYGSGYNGVNEDALPTRLSGCPSKQFIRLRDRYARALALLTCMLYADKNHRTYGVNILSHGVVTLFTRGIGQSVGHRNDECTSARTMRDIVNVPMDTVVCWQFLTDMRDMYCHYKGGRSDFLNRVLGTPESLTDSADNLSSMVVPIRGDVVRRDKRRKTCAATFGFGRAEFTHRFVLSPDQKHSIAQEAAAQVGAHTKGTTGWRVSTTRGGVLSPTTAPDYKRSVSMNAAGVCIGGRAFCTPEDTRFKRYIGADGSEDKVPFINIDNPRDRPNPTAVREAPAGGWSVLGASSRASKISVAWVGYNAFRSLRYSRLALENAAEWLEAKFGNMGNLIATPLNLLASTAGALEYGLGRAILHLARSNGVCSRRMSDEDCMCDVVEPLSDVFTDLWRTPPPLTGSNRAITVHLSSGVGGHLSAIGAGSGGGLYFTFHWMLDGKVAIGFDIGGFAGSSFTVALGTNVASAGVSEFYKFGIFFGLQSEKSAWSKGFEFGVDIGASANIDVELLFREGYMDVDFKKRCNPISFTGHEAVDTGLRFLTFPVNPVCIRGFALAIEGGAETPTVVKTNVYTSLSYGKSLSLLSWNTRDGIGSQVYREMKSFVDESRKERDRRRRLAKRERRRQERREREERARLAREQVARRKKAEHDTHVKARTEDKVRLAQRIQESTHTGSLKFRSSYLLGALSKWGTWFCTLDDQALHSYLTSTEVTGRGRTGVNERGMIDLSGATVEIEDPDKFGFKIHHKNDKGFNTETRLRALSREEMLKWMSELTQRINLLSLPDGWEEDDTYRIDPTDGLVRKKDWPESEVLETWAAKVLEEVSADDDEDEGVDNADKADLEEDDQSVQAQLAGSVQGSRPHRGHHDKQAAANASSGDGKVDGSSFHAQLLALDKDLGDALDL